MAPGPVIELVGPAGAGKTTLAGVLGGVDPSDDLPRLQAIAALVPQLPMLGAARCSSPGRNWSREELRSLGYLGAWQSRIRANQEQAPLVFDHGPVFRLASLTTWGPPMTRSVAFSRGWRRLAREWGGLLDVVVWLDAPDDVLIRRIAGREQDHRIRGVRRAEAEAFLARYRTAYRTTIDIVTGGGARVVELDTTAGSPDRLADALRAAVGAPGGWPG